jgi:hypothetical protein
VVIAFIDGQRRVYISFTNSTPLTFVIFISPPFVIFISPPPCSS